MDRINTQSRPQGELREQKNNHYARPKRMEWIRKTNRKLRLVRGMMVVLCGMIAVIGALLLILPAFKVKKIEVKGDLVVTTPEEIIAASGVEYGTEIIGTNWKIASSNIEKQCHVQVEEMRISPFKVTFVVKEKEVLRMQYGEYWVSLDENFRVMDASLDASEFEGLLQIRLPAIASVSPGEMLQFTEGKIDLEYVTEMIGFLDESGIKSRVDLLDVSEKFNVTCTMDSTYRVVLGKVGDLANKMEIADEIISLKNGADPYAVIDVSNVEKSIYRPVEKSELLLIEK